MRIRLIGLSLALILSGCSSNPQVQPTAPGSTATVSQWSTSVESSNSHYFNKRLEQLSKEIDSAARSVMPEHYRPSSSVANRRNTYSALSTSGPYLLLDVVGRASGIPLPRQAFDMFNDQWSSALLFNVSPQLSRNQLLHLVRGTLTLIK